MRYYIITPIFLGSVCIDRSDSLLGVPRGKSMCTVYACFVLQSSEGEIILVDSGLMPQERICNENLPFRRMKNALDLLDALRLAGFNPDQIQRCILTHLHYDHCCNLSRLQSLKEIYVQKEEILYALLPAEEDAYYYMKRADCGHCEWMDSAEKFHIVDGDMQIEDGLRVFLTPGHSRGSQCAAVRTREGEYILTGDTIALYESYEKGIPNRICYDVDVWKESIEKIRAMRAEILPGHDAAVFRKKNYG